MPLPGQSWSMRAMSLAIELSTCVFLTSMAMMCVSCRNASTSWVSHAEKLTVTMAFTPKLPLSSSKRASVSLQTVWHSRTPSTLLNVCATFGRASRQKVRIHRVLWALLAQLMFLRPPALLLQEKILSLET